MEYYAGIKKEGTRVTCNDVDEPGGYYAKRDKPVITWSRDRFSVQAAHQNHLENLNNFHIQAASQTNQRVTSAGSGLQELPKWFQHAVRSRTQNLKSENLISRFESAPYLVGGLGPVT